MLLERKILVGVRDGLHARPATQFVKLARGFTSSIEIERKGKRADAKSSVRLMLLGVKEQDEVTLHVDGADADEALRCLTAFISDADAGTALPEAAAPASVQPPVAVAAAAAEAELRGVPASEGAALGAAFPFFPETLLPAAPHVAQADIEQEVTRHRAALETTIARLRERGSSGHEETDAIIEALTEVASDPAFLSGTAARIRIGIDAVTATLEAGEEIAQSFEAVEDPYIRARSEDMRSVARNVALTLLGRSEVSLAEIPAGAIVIADDLSAWELSTADLSRIGGLVCRSGTPLSHVSIMARSHGIPAVVGYAAPADRLRDVRTVGLDGRTGEVFLDPDEAVVARLSSRIAEETRDKAAFEMYRTMHPVTRDGRSVIVAANIGGVKDIDPALRAGAQGVGLFRTEFLFMERKTLPTEDEQTRIYSRVVQAFAPHHVIVRTLDVGGDKPVAGIEFPHEENPFLGWRGVRMCLDRPDVFKPQLRALLRAAACGPLKVMLPMVADAGEIRAVRSLVDACHAELEAEGRDCAAFELGIMVETPAAALMAEELAQEVAFFSIGTNDLTQYVMAADRLNPKVAALNRAEHPAVLRAIEGVCRAGKKAGIPVGICGEAAARPDLIKTFVEMGVTELSMSPSAIPRAKKCVMDI
jgi:phosphotransferase system enzyme I (PtsI)